LAGHIRIVSNPFGLLEFLGFGENRQLFLPCQQGVVCCVLGFAPQFCRQERLGYDGHCFLSVDFPIEWNGIF